jgi:hypothetical protein
VPATRLSLGIDDVIEPVERCFQQDGVEVEVANDW